jgi:hypothetical protein
MDTRTFFLALGVCTFAACGGDEPSADAGAGAAGQNVAGQAMSGAGGNAGAGAANAGAPSSGGAGSTAAGAGGSSSSGNFTKMGACGLRGQSTVNATTFEGYEEFFIISDRGLGDDICVVRFDVKRVGEAPAGCDDPTADVDCLWTHLIERSNPTTVKDVDGVCANSQRKLDAAAIDELDGSRVAYGFVSEFAGHNSVLMKYDDAMAKWDAGGNATWDEQASALRFDRRDGICNY